MKQFILIWVFLAQFSAPLRASIFGEENVALYQILLNAIQQLAKMNEILKSGRESVELVREINRGINDSLNMIRTVQPDLANLEPETYRDWLGAKESLAKIEKVYGAVPKSGESEVQSDADRSVAEAVSLNNSMYDYAKEIDEIGEEVKRASHLVSPGGAQKLTAQSLGVMLHVMNSSLRAQATALKLQAQSMGMMNRQSKMQTKHQLDSTQAIQTEFGRKAKFQIPRF